MFFGEGIDGENTVRGGAPGGGGRNSQLLVGTAEVRESAEQAAVLAVLDATNRWYLLQR